MLCLFYLCLIHFFLSKKTFNLGLFNLFEVNELCNMLTYIDYAFVPKTKTLYIHEYILFHMQ